MNINIIDRDPEQVIYEIKEIVHKELIAKNAVTTVLREMLPAVKAIDTTHMTLAIEVYCLREAIRRYTELSRPETKGNLVARMFPDKNMLDMPVSKWEPEDIAGMPKFYAGTRAEDGTHTLRVGSAKNMLGTIKHHFPNQGK